MAADSDSATGAELHPLLVSPRRLLWARRLPYVLVLVLTGIAAYLLWSWAIQTSNPDASALMLGLFAIALGALGGTFLLLFTNRMGVFREGIAPPWKSPRHLLREPYIVRWRDISSVSLDPRVEAMAPPDRWEAAVKLRSGLAFVFTSADARDRFSSTSQARTLYGLLRLVDMLQPGPFHLEESDPAVRAVLARGWTEVPRPPRSQASKMGVVLGGTGLLLLSIFLELGPNGWRQSVASLWALAGIVFLISLLSPNLLSRAPQKNA